MGVIPSGFESRRPHQYFAVIVVLSMPIMLWRSFLVFCAAALLAACAVSDDQAARFLVAPDKYQLFRCDAIAREVKARATREQELKQLMAKAGTGLGGQLIGDLAYRSEYLSVRGDLNELRRAAADKHCAETPSDSAPAARASDKAIH